jgi:hypothetical protein
VCLPGDGCLEVIGGLADGQAGRRIADDLQELQMAMGVAGLAFGGGAEHGGYVIVALDVGLLSEIEITAIRLRFAGEGGFQIFFGLAALEHSHFLASEYSSAAVRPATQELE